MTRANLFESLAREASLAHSQRHHLRRIPLRLATDG